ncbi:uncharacterized protein LOC113240318 [Hyposmocoma kahamanoa]|uniref:uncharacterized protein LOC113240318 n=1 Tax=Hyposmocoma kahamanoa TaxID=1477025 RepID=UPI000E6D6D43|nr:uncharacterized protein LOC113240318 [Hyposmocoma kahamanoa]
MGRTSHRNCVICGKQESQPERMVGSKFFASFPLDEIRCKEWLRAVGIEDLAYMPIEKLNERRHICGDHFGKSHFNKKMNRLKKVAVPKLQLSSPPLTDKQLQHFPLHTAAKNKTVPIPDAPMASTSKEHHVADPVLIPDRLMPSASKAPLIADPKLACSVRYKPDASLPSTSKEHLVADVVLMPDTSMPSTSRASLIADPKLDDAMVSEPMCEQSDDDVLLYEPMSQEVEDTQIKHTEETSSGLAEELKCNLCEQTIRGPFRYSCVQCYDFDLCGACEARGAHQMHYVLRAPGHKNISEVQSLIRVIRQALTADMTVPASQYSDELKMEIKEEAVERSEPFPDDNDPLSWDVQLETKDDSTETDTTVSADEEESHPKRRTSSSKKNTKPIVKTFASTSKPIQSVAVSNNNSPIRQDIPSKILETNLAISIQTPEILKTNAAVHVQTLENNTMRQPTVGNLL